MRTFSLATGNTSLNVSVFTADGAEDLASLKLYTDEDQDALAASFDAAGCARLHRRVIMDRLRDLRTKVSMDAAKSPMPAPASEVCSLLEWQVFFWFGFD